MIQIYAPENTNFDMNGDEVLTPSVCTMEAELRGAWFLNMTHPIDDEGKWKNIVKEAVISAPTFMGKKQLFRIEESDKQDTEIVVTAYPIFFDSADEVFLMDKRPTDKNGQEAIDILTEGTKYSGESNITSVNTAYFIRRNLMNALNGKIPSFVGAWGGEPVYDNFKVIINERAGGDYGAEVRYGKNMDGISFKEDMSEVVTRIVPVAFNGRTLSTSYVDSPLINKYAKVYTREIVFEDVKYYEDIMASEDTSNLIVCNSQEELDVALIAKCNEQFEAGIDVYKVTIGVDMVSLENTEEYKDFTDLVRIGLGDTVGCYNKRLDITTKARAIKIKWDCITDSVEKVVLGDYEFNILDQWNSTISKIENIINDDGTVAAEKIQGILNAIDVQLHYQKSAAQKQEVRAILFEDLDPDSPLYGAMCLGTQGLQISNKRTADGRDWDWTTAFTANGGYANAIIAGILADKTGENFWNLDTGDFSMSAKTKVGNSTVASMSDVNNVKRLAIKSVDVMYALGNSTDTAPTDGWSTNAPEWENGKYMWQKTVTIYADDSKSESNATCISGATGQHGKDGVGILSIEEQYYLSPSDKEQKDGTWSTNQPEWEEGYFIWTRSKVTWDNSTVTYTDPVLAAAINGANQGVSELDKKLTQEEIFNRLTKNGTVQGMFMKDGQLYINVEYLAGNKISGKSIDATDIYFYNDTDNIESTLVVQPGYVDISVCDNNYSNPALYTSSVVVGANGLLYLIGRNIEIYEHNMTTWNGSVKFLDTVYNNGGGVAFTSDRNEKHSIEELGDVSNFIYSLKPCKFKYNSGTSDRYHHGLIAQEVKECMGEEDWGLYVKQTDEDGTEHLALRYDELIADLIVTAQSQNKRIQQLEERLGVANV